MVKVVGSGCKYRFNYTFPSLPSAIFIFILFLEKKNRRLPFTPPSPRPLHIIFLHIWNQGEQWAVSTLLMKYFVIDLFISRISRFQVTKCTVPQTWLNIIRGFSIFPLFWTKTTGCKRWRSCHYLSPSSLSPVHAKRQYVISNLLMMLF